jgi:predicted acyl esterase
VAVAGVAAAAPAAEDGAAARTIEAMAPMRDGVRLATTVFLPAGAGPWPAVLARTPYSRVRSGASSSARYNEAGYAWVIQDQRGRFDSEGTYQPHEVEMNDGYDTVEWMAAQPWSNGKVGMTGASALGIAANLAAAAAPPHLVTAYVVVAPHSLFYEGRFIGGVFKEADTGNWMRGQGVADAEVAAYRKRVLLDQRWEDTDLVFHLDQVRIPIFNVGGWYDLFSSGNIANFRYLQEWGREGARGRQKLLMGAFGHGPLQGDLEYPDAGSLRGREGDELRWFDYWLKGVDNGIMDEPAVTYYQMAAARKGAATRDAGNRYVTSSTWPPPESRPTRFYLQEGRRLSTTASTGASGATSYSSDPARPVPTVGGPNLTLPIGPMLPDRTARRESHAGRQARRRAVDHERRARHRRHGEAGRRLSRRIRGAGGRHRPARTLPRGPPRRGRGDAHAGRADAPRGRSVEHGDHDRGRPSPRVPRRVDQSPALRGQPRHRRGAGRGEAAAARRAQHDPPRRGSSERADPAGDVGSLTGGCGR